MLGGGPTFAGSIGIFRKYSEWSSRQSRFIHTLPARLWRDPTSRVCSAMGGMDYLWPTRLRPSHL
jgi:hypothetical protein